VSAAKSSTVKKTANKAAVKAKPKKVKEKVKPKKKVIKIKEKVIMSKKKEAKTETKEVKEVKKVDTAVNDVKVNNHDVPEVEVTSPKKVVKKIKGYGKDDLDEFRRIILYKRNEILEQLQNLREQMMDPTTGQYVNESSPYSLHMAEQGTDAMEREKIFLWAQRENKFLGYLDDALQRIENGTYGICLDCIDEPQNLCPTCPLIPKERLAAVPHSQLCLPIKQRQEKK
jgi:RNA polymerase-binding transcription factor DksA